MVRTLSITPFSSIAQLRITRTSRFSGKSETPPGCFRAKLTRVSHFSAAAVSLPGHFSVWLASAEARFLTGRFVYANWDVEELKGRAAEIERSDLLKIGLIGEPAGGAVAGNGVACLNDRFGRTCGYHV